MFLFQLGLERNHGVGILGFNSPEWFISDVGCILAGYDPVQGAETQVDDVFLFGTCDSPSSVDVTLSSDIL